MSSLPAFFAASAIFWASAGVMVMGFSIRTCLPLLRASMVIGAWSALGTAMETASSSSIANMRFALVNTCLAPYWPANCCASALFRSQMARISTPGTWLNPSI